MEKHLDELETFTAISVPLTGYTRVELLATGMAAPYLDAIRGIIGASTLAGYLREVAAILQRSGGKEPELNREIRMHLLASLQYGPLTRNIVHMWYWGSWLALPDDWVAQYGKDIQHNTQHFISATAYTEGLIWNATGTHPQGAKQPGFGSWSVLPL